MALNSEKRPLFLISVSRDPKSKILNTADVFSGIKSISSPDFITELSQFKNKKRQISNNTLLRKPFIRTKVRYNTSDLKQKSICYLRVFNNRFFWLLGFWISG